MVDDPPKILCTSCMQYHPAPMCDHNAALPCLTCGQARGYRWSARDGTAAGTARECWRCWYAAQPVGSLT
jgi:hypothetical protein